MLTAALAARLLPAVPPAQGGEGRERYRGDGDRWEYQRDGGDRYRFNPDRYNPDRYDERRDGRRDARREDYYGDCLSSREVNARLNSEGWHELQLREQKNGVLVMRAIHRGREYLVFLDGCSGEVFDTRQY